MAAKKQINYIEYELDWYEQTIKELRDFVDMHRPFKNIPDRSETEINAKGAPIIRLIAKKEETITVLKNILKDLPDMFRALGQMREQKIAAQLETRGNKKVPGIMDKFIEEREGPDK